MEIRHSISLRKLDFGSTKIMIYKDTQDNISVRFTNYIKQGASSSDLNLLDEEFEENISMTLVDNSPDNIDEMKELLDHEFKQLMIIHNQDHKTIMNIYHDMYSLDYLDDIMKGVKPPFDVLKT